MANEELGIESMHDGGNSAEEYDGELLQTNFSRGNGFSNNITTRPEEDSELDDFNDFDMHNDEEKESAMASLNLRDRERSVNNLLAYLFISLLQVQCMYQYLPSIYLCCLHSLTVTVTVLQLGDTFQDYVCQAKK